MENIFDNIIAKAWDDDVFKKELLVKPRIIIEKEIGGPLNIPTNKRIVISDQSDSSVFYLNIPRKLDIDDIAISDEDMENISGGGPWAILGAAFVYGALVYGAGYACGRWGPCK